jgi:hypothetical protein
MAEETVAIKHGNTVVHVSADQVQAYLKDNPGAEVVGPAEDDEAPKGKSKRKES